MHIRIVFLIMSFCFVGANASELRFHKTEETLNKIMEIISKKEKGMYLRFGDGDVNLAYGESELYQTSNRLLQSEMKESFQLNGPSILKGLPLQCRELNGYEDGMFPGNHECPYAWSRQILEKAKNIWGAEISDVYSAVALPFAATHKQGLAVRFLQFLKKSPTFLFVGNENIPASVRDSLFGPDCKFVPTPAQNSYSAMNRIEKQCLQHLSTSSDYKVIVIAMGCSGRILQKRLWNKVDSIFIFDFGSLMDALCGWNSRAWIDLTGFDAHSFLNKLKASEL